jgi:hypothetical protein
MRWRRWLKSRRRPRALKRSSALFAVWLVLSIATPGPETAQGGVVVPPAEVEFSAAEERSLAALCWVECRGMQDQRAACCTSVIDTVMTRISRGKMTDGTVIGTIRYGCGPETKACQFPAFVTRGCQGITHPCPFYDEEGLELFGMIVKLYEERAIETTCGGYLFYGLKSFDRPECRIEAQNGQFVNLHNGKASTKDGK